MKLLLGFAVTVAFTFGFVPPTAAQSTVDFSVSGNSTIRGWTCEVTGTATLTAGGGDAAPGFASGVQGVVLTVPVAEFTCPNEEMTEHLMEAMRPDEHAEITFEIESYDVTPQGAQAAGSLTILDTTEAVTVSLQLTPAGAGAALLGGSSGVGASSIAPSSSASRAGSTSTEKANPDRRAVTGRACGSSISTS